MSRLSFDSEGKLIGIDAVSINKGFSSKIKRYDYNDNDEDNFSGELKKTKEKSWKRFTNLNDSKYWSLYRNETKLEPLKFSNGKTQEDIVKEIVQLIKDGNKLILLKGMCGTGKSSIALNIARVLGRAAVVVPVKSLQRQYEEDYMNKMSVIKANGEELKIAMITGRSNHDSLIKPGVSCADPFLPENIQITEKNFQQVKDYYLGNSLIKHKSIDNIKQLRRISIAPANPYWSPIIPSEYNMQLSDAVQKRYLGLGNREFIFYHRKKGCSYYDQYQSYIDSDVIIFNSAKYKIEVALNRKPETEVDIIDEADEFLDSFSNKMELNLTRLSNSLNNIIAENEDVREVIDSITQLISLEEKNKRALGIDENKIFHIKETNLIKIFELFLRNRNVESEISLDDLSYANKGIEVSKQFIDFIEDTYLTYKKYEDNLYANLVTTDLSRRLKDIIEKNKALVFMSGTLHSEEVLKNIFGINNCKIVEAETSHQGEIEILKTGKEFDCSYKNLKNGNATREQYLKALASSIEKAPRPVLIHVNAFEDLPTNEEIVKYSLGNIMSKEKLIDLQANDKTGRLVSLFKNKMSDSLYSTKCSRGVDFPGDICKSMVFTKYPNPNVQNSFWKILEKTHPQYFWDFYRDKARREFLQRLYRALRSKDDHVFVLSPDSRVLDAVREQQLNHSNKI